MLRRFATPHGTYQGRKVFKVPVVVSLNNSRQHPLVDGVEAKVETTIIARSAAEAANFVRDQYETRPETEVYAWGPRGGEVYRYVGWYSAIGVGLLNNPDQHQLPLPLP